MEVNGFVYKSKEITLSTFQDFFVRFGQNRIEDNNSIAETNKRVVLLVVKDQMHMNDPGGQ